MNGHYHLRVVHLFLYQEIGLEILRANGVKKNCLYYTDTHVIYRNYRTVPTTHACLKGSLAQWASRFVGRREPLVEAGTVELMLAGLARQPRKAVVARVENAVADWALLHALKLLVEIALPRADRLCYSTVLQRSICKYDQTPFSCPWVESHRLISTTLSFLF